ncbi:hypothetical protein NDU88_008090 [Pleurodeles waltl]|uniref:Uncharacterized protein n=1 Tax=Pleurodeles waltl TaxID=8319 RepID=A0AAV7NV70_PLEWA|nr:hypothetical protein NDU88_008090 [Pleurodeles waltl]
MHTASVHMEFSIQATETQTSLKRHHLERVASRGTRVLLRCARLQLHRARALMSARDPEQRSDENCWLKSVNKVHTQFSEC